MLALGADRTCYIGVGRFRILMGGQSIEYLGGGGGGGANV